MVWSVDGNPSEALIEGGVFLASKAGTYIVTAASRANPAMSDFATVTVSSSVSAMSNSPMNLVTHGSTATALKDGRILFLPGCDKDYASVYADALATYYISAWLYDPAAKTWTRAGDRRPRAYHHAVCLNDGRVLVAGGIGPGRWDTELFDPATGVFTLMYSYGSGEQNMNGEAWARGSSLLLKNGDALLAGGSNICFGGGATGYEGWQDDFHVGFTPPANAWTRWGITFPLDLKWLWFAKS